MQADHAVEEVGGARPSGASVEEPQAEQGLPITSDRVQTVLQRMPEPPPNVDIEGYLASLRQVAGDRSQHFKDHLGKGKTQFFVFF